MTPDPVLPTNSPPHSQVNQTSVGSYPAPNGTPGTFSAAGIGADVSVGVISITDLNTKVAYTDNYNQVINVSMVIRDVASGQTNASNPFSFNGTLTGNVQHLTPTGKFGSSLNNPWTAGGVLVEQRTIGGVVYTVTLDPTKAYVAPGAPPSNGGTGLTGGYSVHVTAAPIPEPTSLALAGIGSLMVIGFVRRRRARA